MPPSWLTDAEFEGIAGVEYTPRLHRPAGNERFLVTIRRPL
jgi:hypothetical protein